MKKIMLAILLLVGTFDIYAQSRNCVDFEPGGAAVVANWQQNGNVSKIETASAVIREKEDKTHVLSLTDGSGASIAYNSTDFKGNWVQKYLNKCLCFDYKIDYNQTIEPSRNYAPKIMIYSGANPSRGESWSVGLTYATFVMNNINVDNVWKNYCLPIGLANGNTLPSNEYGHWEINSPTPGQTWNTLIQNVTGIILPTDYNSEPSEVIQFDNFCSTDCKSTSVISTPENCYFCCTDNGCEVYRLPIVPSIKTPRVVCAGTAISASSVIKVGCDAKYDWTVTDSNGKEISFSGDNTPDISIMTSNGLKYVKICLSIICGSKSVSNCVTVNITNKPTLAEAEFGVTLNCPGGNGLGAASGSVTTIQSGTNHVWLLYEHNNVPSSPCTVGLLKGTVTGTNYNFNNLITQGKFYTVMHYAGNSCGKVKKCKIIYCSTTGSKMNIDKSKLESNAENADNDNNVDLKKVNMIDEK